MAYRARNLLHFSKVEVFAKWLESLGWKKEPVKGAYEVLRMRFDKGTVLIIYMKAEAKEHCTTFGIGTEMVRKWLRTYKR